MIPRDPYEFILKVASEYPYIWPSYNWVTMVTLGCNEVSKCLSSEYRERERVEREREIV